MANLPPTSSTWSRGNRSRYFASIRSIHRVGGSTMCESAENMKYLFAAPGHADPAHPEVVPGVSKRHALTGSFTPSRGCSISSSCPFCATESEHRALRRGVERGVDVSHLRVLESARVAAFVADAALLQSAP